ncbi:MAG: hypothetical protein JWL77_568 [Chthonomonadaceae bacterium]|nr:hypothetical protein [Chthonomonadaceae bacterium]
MLANRRRGLVAEDKTEERGPERFVIDLLATFLLFLAISAVAGALTATVEAGMGFPQDSPTYQTEHYENSPGSLLWLVVCCCGSAVVWRRTKPSPKVWTLPFLLASGWWWLSLKICDGPREAVAVEFARRMFFPCCLVTIVGIIRLLLGEGRQQTKTLKRLVFGIASVYEASVYETPVTPNETLLRASSQPETSGEILLRPAADAAETAPEQLLRASRSEDQ